MKFAIRLLLALDSGSSLSGSGNHAVQKFLARGDAYVATVAAGGCRLRCYALLVVGGMTSAPRVRGPVMSAYSNH